MKMKVFVVANNHVWLAFSESEQVFFPFIKALKETPNDGDYFYFKSYIYEHREFETMIDNFPDIYVGVYNTEEQPVKVETVAPTHEKNTQANIINFPTRLQ